MARLPKDQPPRRTGQPPPARSAQQRADDWLAEFLEEDSKLAAQPMEDYTPVLPPSPPPNPSVVDGIRRFVATRCTTPSPEHPVAKPADLYQTAVAEHYVPAGCPPMQFGAIMSEIGYPSCHTTNAEGEFGPPCRRAVHGGPLPPCARIPGPGENGEHQNSPFNWFVCRGLSVRPR
ncbi:hypothetical protein VST63_19185 [Mycolicibacterium sp. 050232]|uniref:hypothetical protein n=1 Tax=Mycolicibacterium sp. 050232 TaxID=3113982 RepID=UPI002E2A93F9|nr:hypothetical protein [Mycolicibacterium sp. 050232]MED5814486.1 hypothetical protein [Mycolicibacterium sp. 050232]